MRRTALVLRRTLGRPRVARQPPFARAVARMSRCWMRTAKRRRSHCLALPLPASLMYRSTTGSPTPIFRPCSSASRPRASSATWSVSGGSPRRAAIWPGHALRSSARRKSRPTAKFRRTNPATGSPSSSSPAARPPRRRRPCCATRICSRTSWAPWNLARHRWTKQRSSACRLITLPESRRCSVRSTRSGASCCCRPSIPTTGSRSPPRSARPTPLSCRRCSHGSSPAWMPASRPIFRH